MIDLASLFQEASAEHGAGEHPDFPTPRKSELESQVPQQKDISGISGISNCSITASANPRPEIVQARARVRGGERARGIRDEVPEKSEQPEKATPAKGSLSNYPSKKSENEREVGKVLALPGRDGVALWRAGLTRLVGIDPDRPTAKVGYRPGEWSKVYARAVTFLDQFGDQAEALGWTAPRLFGVHPIAGIVRVDACGALVLPTGGAVRAITATEISFGGLTHREMPGQITGIPIWEFGQ